MSSASCRRELDENLTPAATKELEKAAQNVRVRETYNYDKLVGFKIASGGAINVKRPANFIDENALEVPDKVLKTLEKQDKELLDLATTLRQEVRDESKYDLDSDDDDDDQDLLARLETLKKRAKSYREQVALEKKARDEEKCRLAPSLVEIPLTL